MTTNPKLTIIHGHTYASSLDIARHFHKEHKNVLRDVERLINEISPSNFEPPNEFSRLNFEPAEYKDRRGKIQPLYNLTRDGFTLLAMGFTGAEALFWKIAYITAFNEMETELQRRNLKDGQIQQMNLFPSLEQAIANDRPTLSVTAVLTIIAYEGLMIPIVTRSQIISMIKRNRIDGFNDGRTWQVYQDSFDTFLRHRRMSVAKAA